MMLKNKYMSCNDEIKITTMEENSNMRMQNDLEFVCVCKL